MTDQLFIRAFPAQLERTQEHELTGRLLPYNIVADVLDELPDGKLDVYREGFRRGAFEPQVSAARINKISLVHSHEGGLGYLGPFVALREEDDGLYGDVRVLPSKADDVGALLEAGVQELSVEFRLPRNNHTEVDGEGVRWRTRAHLDRVALEPKGAYSTAQVLAYRAEVDEQQRQKAEAEAEAAAREAETQRMAEALLKETEEKLERRRRFEELTGRLANYQNSQHELVKQYGVTRPGGFDRRQETQP